MSKIIPTIEQQKILDKWRKSSIESAYYSDMFFTYAVGFFLILHLFKNNTLEWQIMSIASAGQAGKILYSYKKNKSKLDLIVFALSMLSTVLCAIIYMFYA